MKRVYSGIGGQAVIEGIMMKNGDAYATAVRKTDGEIAVGRESYVNVGKRHPFLALPLVRGVVSFVESMALGIKTLTYSASFFEDDESQEPTGFEKWLMKTFGDKTNDIIMGAAMVFAVAIAVVIFMILPTLISNLLRRFIDNYYLMSLIEGFVRLGIFILYILLISRMDDINRTFMYHGAEHKCINCVELGLPLTVDNVMASSKEHKRCGTSFLVIVMTISIIFFMFIKVDNVWMRVLSRIVFIPVVAGISYEFLRIAGRSESPLVNALSRPGMWMQGLTTKEPTADMCEVAIAATESVFDWKAFLRDNFGWEEPETEVPEAEPETDETEATGSESEESGASVKISDI